VYQPRLQHGAGIAAFFVGHRGHRFASSALIAPMTAAFTADISQFIAARGLDLVRFAKGQRKDDLTRQYLQRAGLDDRGLLHDLHRLEHGPQKGTFALVDACGGRARIAGKGGTRGRAAASSMSAGRCLLPIR